MAETKDYAMEELRRESRIGGMGTETGAREIRRIDLSDFDRRKPEIAEELWSASTEVGFFQLVGHGIPLEEIEAAFETSERFFALSEEIKSQYPLIQGTNAGWEFKAQVRPSTGTADQKESYQITRPRMDGLWPSEAELPGFKEQMLGFEAKAWGVAMRVLSCFALKLGFPDDFFATRHDPTRKEYQSTLRLIHYLPMEAADVQDGYWRAGAHTDFDCLTVLFQKTGQGGLQVCPGKDRESAAWTSVEPETGVITCNIGDMLMRWSDDQLQSTLHRVRMPKPGEYDGPRFSLPFFAQADTDAVIEGPNKLYPPITAADYLKQRIAANFAK